MGTLKPQFNSRIGPLWGADVVIAGRTSAALNVEGVAAAIASAYALCPVTRPPPLPPRRPVR
jgi:hypothetical protein